MDTEYDIEDEFFDSEDEDALLGDSEGGDEPSKEKSDRGRLTSAWDALICALGAVVKVVKLDAWSVKDLAARLVAQAESMALSANEYIRCEGLSFKDATKEYWKVLLEDVRDVFTPLAQSAGRKNRTVVSWVKAVSDPLRTYAHDRLNNLLAGVDTFHDEITKVGGKVVAKVLLWDLEVKEWDLRAEMKVRMEEGHRSQFAGRKDRFDLDDKFETEWEASGILGTGVTRTGPGSVLILDGHRWVPLYPNEADQWGFYPIDGKTKNGRPYTDHLVSRSYVVRTLKVYIRELLRFEDFPSGKDVLREIMDQKTEVREFVLKSLESEGVTREGFEATRLESFIQTMVAKKGDLKWIPEWCAKNIKPFEEEDLSYLLGGLAGMGFFIPGWAWAKALTLKRVDEAIENILFVLKTPMGVKKWGSGKYQTARWLVVRHYHVGPYKGYWDKEGEEESSDKHEDIASIRARLAAAK